ncbi:hypothetical protein [Sulfuricurvum sp.]|uniref:hypothetical protein n=1 Tax=Sulfuricurvum sp. TaxID=2025608 RepID=UPI002628D325|nr:hypothetical protein [Sulfuricurvum sp.]MDD4950825.1 hypothetical protein [Sulfuricurvum sp.]
MPQITFLPFQNESESFEIDGITLENRLDRVSIYGSIEITKDTIGLEKALKLKRLLDATVDELKRQRGSLPEHIEITKEETIKNPFE